MVFVRGVADGLWGLSHDFERLQRNSRCCPAPSSEVEAQLFGGGHTNGISPYILSKSTSEPLSTLELTSSQSPRDAIIEFGSTTAMNVLSAEGAFERLPCTICKSISEPFSALDILASGSPSDAVVDLGNTMLSESILDPVSTLDISSSRSPRDIATEFENTMVMHVSPDKVSKSTLDPLSTLDILASGSSSDVVIEFGNTMLSESILDPVSTLDISSSRSPRDIATEFENIMVMHVSPDKVSKSTLDPLSTLDILASGSSSDVVIEFENTMAMHVVPNILSKSTLDPVSIFSSQSSRDVVIDFGSNTARKEGSALQVYFDLRFIYTHTLVLTAVLVLAALIIYKAFRVSPSSSDAERLVESLLFLHPDNLQQHDDPHRHLEQQRTRIASSDGGDESNLSISDGGNRYVAFEKEDFQLVHLAPTATAVFEEELVPTATAGFEEEDFQLEQLVPEATAAERLRFLVAKKGNVKIAAKSLEAYLQWRGDHQHNENHGEPALLDMELYTDDSDWNDWNIASAAACKAYKETSQSILPRIARLHQIKGSDIRDLQGYRVLRLISGQMDDRLVSLTTYATAVALYIDRKLARESTERVTLCIDLRGGPGWRNLHVVKVLPFIRTTTKLLLNMFPGRLERAVVYPLTPAFRWIWPICKRWIDPLTAEKICILTGPATIVSPPPISQMIKYLDESIVALLEKARAADFVTSSPEDSLQQS